MTPSVCQSCGTRAASVATGPARRAGYPVGRAAALEATGLCADECNAAMATLSESRDTWTALGRPLDVAWCDVLIARVCGPERRVGHLAEHARALGAIG